MSTVLVKDCPLMFDAPHYHTKRRAWYQRASPTKLVTADTTIFANDVLLRAVKPEEQPLLADLVIVAHNTWMYNLWAREDHTPVPPPHIGDVWLCNVVLRITDGKQMLGVARPGSFVSYASPWTWEVEYGVPPLPGESQAKNRSPREAESAWQPSPTGL